MAERGSRDQGVLAFPPFCGMGGNDVVPLKKKKKFCSLDGPRITCGRSCMGSFYALNLSAAGLVDGPNSCGGLSRQWPDL